MFKSRPDQKSNTEGGTSEYTGGGEGSTLGSERNIQIGGVTRYSRKREGRETLEGAGVRKRVRHGHWGLLEEDEKEGEGIRCFKPGP